MQSRIFGRHVVYAGAKVSHFFEIGHAHFSSIKWQVVTIKNAVLDLCEFMRLCSQNRTKPRFMSEKLALILETYCYY